MSRGRLARDDQPGNTPLLTTRAIAGIGPRALCSEVPAAGGALVVRA